MKILDKLCFEKKDYIAEIKKRRAANPNVKMYIWGTGSVANGAAQTFLKNNIPFNGFFVNVENYTLDPRIAALSMPIFNFDELLKPEGRGYEFDVVVGHSHYELASDLKKYPQIQKIYYLAAITRDDTNISADFVKENIDALQKTYDKLADELSKKNLIVFLNTQLTGDNSYIFEVFDKASSYFDNDVVTLSNNEVYLDLGAYDGYSAEKFISLVKNSNYKIFAVEIQKEMCDLLNKKFTDNPRVKIFNIAVSDKCGVDFFSFNAQSTSLSKYGQEMEVITVDKFCERENIKNVSTVKICIGGERGIVPVLVGAKKIISRYLPKILVAIGLNKNNIINCIPIIEDAAKSKYKFYLRFTNASTEALYLYAVPA